MRRPDMEAVDEAVDAAMGVRPGRRLRAIVLLVLVAVSSVVVFHGITRPSMLGDETIYALVSRESVARGSVLPLFMPDGMPYLDKPPAKIVLVTILFSIFGESPFVARCPDALIGIAAIALVFWWVSGRFGVIAGLVGSVLMLGSSNLLTVHGIRENVMDGLLMLTGFVLLTTWIRYRESGGHQWPPWLLVATGLVLAGMLKPFFGVIFGLILTAAELVAFVVPRLRPTRLLPATALLGIAVVVDAAYLAIMTAFVGDLYIDNMTRQTITRVTDGIDPGHLEGFVFYALDLWGQFGWWLTLVIPGVVALYRRAGAGKAGSAWLLPLWAAAIVAGFSISVSKLSWYVYSAYPPLTATIAVGTAAVFSRLPRGAWRWLATTLVGIALVLAIQRGWYAVQHDDLTLDVERFVRAYEALDADKILAVDAGSIRADGRIRSWVRYYFEGAPHVAWYEEDWPGFDSSAPKCRFVATATPGRFRAGSPGDWRLIGSLRKIDPLAGDVYLIGTCELPGLVLDGLFWSRPPDVVFRHGFDGHENPDWNWAVGTGAR